MLLKNIIFASLIPLIAAQANNGALDQDAGNNGRRTSAAEVASAGTTEATQANTKQESAATVKSEATEATQQSQAIAKTESQATQNTLQTTAQSQPTAANTDQSTTVWWTPSQSVWWTPTQTVWWTPSTSAEVSTIVSGSSTYLTTLATSVRSGSSEPSFGSASNSKSANGKLTTEKDVVLTTVSFTSGSSTGAYTSSYTTSSIHTVNSNSSSGANALLVQGGSVKDSLKIVVPVCVAAGALIFA